MTDGYEKAIDYQGDGKKKRRKIDKSPAARKRRLKIALIVIACIIGAILLVVAISAIGNAIIDKTLPKYIDSFDKVAYAEGEQLVPMLDEDGYYAFVSDKPFKVVQLTDIHIGGGMFSATKDKQVLNAIAAMVAVEKPDLVIATGDIAYPVPFAAGTANNKRAAKAYADLMEKLGVYWTMTFGNHDTESYSKYSREELTDFYLSEGQFSKNAKYAYCLLQKGSSEISGCGNSIIKVKNSSGIITRALVTVDSHAYLPSDPMGIKWQYDNIHANQTQWYRQEIAKLDGQNAKALSELSEAERAELAKYEKVRSSLFFHIPLKEYKDAWTEYTDNGYRDTANVKYHYGRIGESGKLIYHGVGSDDVYDTMLEINADSAFCGHDHYNNISLDYRKSADQDRSIRLTYGMSLDYLAYVGIAKRGSQRGCTVISYDGLAFDITPENYYQEKYMSRAKHKVEKVKIVEEEIPKK